MFSTIENIKSKFTWSGLSLLIIAVALIMSMFNMKLWNSDPGCGRRIINQDVTSYYSYLPAAFIHKDLTFQFVFEDGKREYYDINCEFWPVPVEGKENAYVIKTTMGIAYLYTPFFLMAHAYASNSSAFEADGFSEPYSFFLILSSVVYLVLGFAFLRLLLLRFFSDIVAGVVMLMTIFGTNLYYYGSTEPAMSHAYSFSLFALFGYLCVLWIDKHKWKYALGIGLVGGLIVLIRPVNILVFLFPLLVMVSNLHDIKARFGFFKEKYFHVIIVVTMAFLVIFPQLLFWKINAGSWVYNPYKEEGFFFSSPHIIDGLFSYRKGWLLYTPIMIFPILGIVLSYFKKRELFWFMVSFLPIQIYVTYSWWNWWYGGSFGSRPMIETYALLALPFGVWTEWIGKQKYRIASFAIIGLLLIILNLFQTARYKNASIDYDSMTKEAYWMNFWYLEPVPGYKESLKSPDIQKALKGEED